MILLKLFLLSTLLFETINASKCKEHGKKISFSIEKVWRSYQKKNEKCDVDQELKKNVQQYYDGCRKATWHFRGPSYSLADNLMHSMEVFMTKLIYFSNSNSTVLAPSSHAILESISKCKKLGISGLVILKEFDKVVLEIVKDMNGIVNTLSNIIGQLTDSVNNALNSVGSTFTNFMKEFIKSSLTDFRDKVDYTTVLRPFQKLMNTVALIAEILLNECELATREVNEAVTVLTLIVHFFGIATQGINTCYQTEFYEKKLAIPQKIELFSSSFDYELLQLTEAVNSVAFPFTESIKALLTNLVDLTMYFNKFMTDVTGPFEGVAINVGVITQNLSKHGVGSVSGNTKGLTNILQGVAPK